MVITIPSANVSTENQSPHATEQAHTIMALTLLKALGVKFVRFEALDVTNCVRCKAVPLDRLLRDPDQFYNGSVSIAEACFAGLPSHEDHLAPESNLSAARVLTIRPDISSLRVLPYNKSTAVVMGTLHDQKTGSPSPLCTRHLLRRVLQTVEEEFKLGFTVGAELEFCLFQPDGTPIDQTLYANESTLDDQQNFINDLYAHLDEQSIDVEQIHAESAPGQVEVVLGKQDDVMQLADNFVRTRHTIRAVARKHKLRALFLPKIFADQAGNGCHIHMSFRDLSPNARLQDKSNAFPRTSVKGAISHKGSSFIEGILSHLPALLSLTMPTTNSFRRVGPGCFTGSSIGWAVEDKESPLRVCLAPNSGEPTNVELKLCDSTANIYLELAAVLTAGLDGMARMLSLRPRMNETGSKFEPLPNTLGESLECLQKDDVLVKMMGQDLFAGFLAVKKYEISFAEGKTLEDEVEMAFNKA